MTIDLDRCVGCRACTVACVIHNGLPKDVRYSYVVERESGVFPQVTVDYLPVLCMHCANPVCVEMCPTGATYKTDEGIVVVNAEKCIGCGACVSACPYGARCMLEDIVSNHGGDPTAYENVVFATLTPGTVQKCTFCEGRLKDGEEPICVATCPANARVFGDLDDPESGVSQAMASKTTTALLASAGTEPSVFYLTEKPLDIDALFMAK